MAIRIGNNRANMINGTSRSDLIFGLSGDDVINAGAGNDIVFGGRGNDQIFAGGGNDRVFAGLGNDVVSGGAGNDFLFGDAGNDVLDGGLGSDLVDGGSGSDTLIFTDAERGGLDRYIGGSGQDSLVLEFAAARWANPAVKAEVTAYLNFLAAGGTGNFTFTTMNLIVSSVEALVVKVDGVIIDPRSVGNTVPTGVADSYSTGENGILNVSPATERGSLVDNDSTGAGAFTVELVTGPARGALTLNANGTFSFNPGAAFDYLAAGQSAVETFTYRIVNSAGVSQPITVSLNIAGANDAASLGGVRSGAVSEDNLVTTAVGTVTIADADAGQAALANPGPKQGLYGSLVLAADGTWTYTINNALAATQALGAGDAGTESFAITSADGTAASDITITVNGVNDIALISGSLEGTVTEDNFTLETESVLETVSGQVTVADADSGESAIGNPGTYAGAYGSLVLNADGSWVYTIDNELPGVQALGGGDSVGESFNVTSLDGAAVQSIEITVQGANDAAEVSGNSGSVLEDELISDDGVDFPPQTSGQIIVADADTGESTVADAALYEGLYGNLNLADDGSWTYTLNNDLASVQALGDGDTALDTFELATFDGTLFDLDITVEGNNDEPDIQGNLYGSVNEDGSSFLNETGTLVATGEFSVTDVDAGESGFLGAGTIDGTYGTLVLAANGQWTYTLDPGRPVVQALRGDQTVTEIFEISAIDGTTFPISIDIQGENDEAFVDGQLSDTIILQFEDTSAEGFVTVDDVDTAESGVLAALMDGSYGTLLLQSDGNWSYELTNFDLPFDEVTTQINENFLMQTLGGDVFNIDITIQQDGLVIG